MPTRFYLPSTGAAAVSPAYAAWNDTDGANARRRMVQAKINSAMSMYEISDSAIGGTPGKRLVQQYVSDPIPAQTITGTVKGQIRCGEEDAGANVGTISLCLKVVSNDGTTLRGTLLALGNYGSTTEFSVNPTLTNRKIADGDALSSVVAQANDRIVVELGVVEGSQLDVLVNMTFGDDSGTDLPEDESTTATNNPWVEFSQDLFTTDLRNQNRALLGVG